MTAALPRPLICLVTDRRRLGAPEGRDLDLLRAQIEIAAHAGVDMIQLRERDLPTRVLEDLVRTVMPLLDGTGSRLIVNARLDVALTCGAAGVHLRHDSFPSDRARSMANPGFLIGRSIYSLDEARCEDQTAAADYLVFGTVFETPSKPEHTGTRLDDLARVAAAVRIPVLAIGGVTIETVRGVADAGAAGLAAIGLFVMPSGGGQSDALARTVRDVRRTFDRPDGLSGR